MAEGKKDWSMAGDILEYHWVLKPSVEFTSTEQLLERLPGRIEQAEKRIEARRERLRKADQED